MGFLGNTLSSYPKRLLIILAVAAIVFTVMGFAEVGKDAFGSHRDFRNMTVSDFREGDIINGTITETIGCAATEETTEYALQFIQTDKYTSSYYYIIPFYESLQSAYPQKIFMYKTGNKKQAQDLEKLLDETIKWYSGNIDAPTTKVRIDRAEITGMTGEERSAFYEYVDDFVDGIFFNEDAQTKAQAKILYHNAMVPYLVTYNSGSGSIFLIIGLAMIGVFALVFIIFIIKSRNSSAKSSGSYTYVGAYTSSDDPNLNSPTGLKNASDDPYFSRGANQVTTPYQQNSARRDYSGSERPMPAMPDRQQPERKILRYDPYTGQPVYAAEKTPAPKPSAPEGDSMPAIDPKTTDQVDLSNGGISPEEKAKYNAPMPTNGSIPVINPESGRNMTDMFGTVIPVQKTEAPAQETKQPPAPEAPVNEVTPIHPQTREDNISSEYQVEQTEIAGRSSIELSSGTMSTVDPYTEQNVDLTNGGIELSDESDSPDTGNRRDIPRARQAVNAPASAQEPAHEPVPVPAQEPAHEPAPVPAQEPVHEPAPAPENKPEPEKKNDYNIFRSTNSSYGSYTSNYTGGSSYNIFKKDENKPSGGDPGFPNADKSLPPIDTSFPTAGESDIGGKDDFDF